MYELGNIKRLSLNVKLFLLFTFYLFYFTSFSFSQFSGALKLQDKNPDELKVGAQQTGRYFPLIKGKSVAVVAHPASLVKNTHLVDTLICSGMNVKKIFAPE